MNKQEMESKIVEYKRLRNKQKELKLSFEEIKKEIQDYMTERNIESFVSSDGNRVFFTVTQAEVFEVEKARKVLSTEDWNACTVKRPKLYFRVE